MASFTSKSVQKKVDEKDVYFHRFKKEGRSCTLAKDKITGSIFLNTAVQKTIATLVLVNAKFKSNKYGCYWHTLLAVVTQLTYNKLHSKEHNYGADTSTYLPAMSCPCPCRSTFLQKLWGKRR